jgi:lipopolysaccharide/colanic/teichoic acid biosynthesis glycosyltransferase
MFILGRIPASFPARAMPTRRYDSPPRAARSRGPRRLVRWRIASLDRKRLFDLSLAAIGVVAALPVFVAAWLAMRLSGDRGPFLYRARRVGAGGRVIQVLKIRTMRASAGGSMLTSAGDPRITAVGAVLRRYRLDELPQLINVLRNEMSLVGPRPEDPSFVRLDDPLHRRVFLAKPGITGPAQLAFRDEASLLDRPDAAEFYQTVVLPAKLRLDAAYLAKATIREDVRWLVRTLVSVFRPSPPSPLGDVPRDHAARVRS